jgi:spoIIIJ-associated protein
MLEKKDTNKIKEATEEFFKKMTICVSIGEINFSAQESGDSVSLEISLDEPQILIGQGGQTLSEIQRLLKMILNKKLQKIFYFNLDINEYKKKKTEYLKNLAKDLADQVALTREKKALLPMSSYERRIIHAELSKRTDVTAESQGEGFDRHIVIKPV